MAATLNRVLNKATASLQLWNEQPRERVRAFPRHTAPATGPSPTLGVLTCPRTNEVGSIVPGVSLPGRAISVQAAGTPPGSIEALYLIPWKPERQERAYSCCVAILQMGRWRRTKRFRDKTEG